MKTTRGACHLISIILLLCASSPAADLVWIGGTGNWNAAGNWSPPQIPTANDNAWITNTGTYTVTVPAGTTASVGSLVVGGTGGTQTLAIDRATLSVNAASAINPTGQLTWLVAQSVVTGPGNLSVNGSLNWSNGTMSGTGVTTIEASGVLTIGSSGVTLGRTLNNGGGANWAGGNLTMAIGGSLNNLAAGTFDISADGRLTGTAATPINNSGLFRLTAGTAGTTIGAPVNNSGSVQVLASVLNLNLGGSHTGVFSNGLAATLNFGGGNHVLSSGSVLTGSGTLSLSGNSTLVANASFDPGTQLNVVSGVANLGAACNVSGTTLNLTGSGGVINFNSLGTVATLNMSAGTLGGNSPILVSGLVTLAGGSVTNSLVFANGGLSISGNTTLSGTKLVNPGTALWTGGNISGANGATISNLVGATFINTFDGNASTGAGATPLFINEGVFMKTNGTAAAGATSIDFQFINTGTVEVQTNTLRYGANQQTAGTTLLDGGSLAAQGQPLQFLGGSLMGTGVVAVANTSSVLNSSSLKPGLPIGELDVTGNYQQTISGSLDLDIGGYSPGLDFDLVTVSAGGAGGIATLGGSLNVTFLNGFSPTNGATFTFLTAGSRVGAFAQFHYPSNDIGLTLSYDSTSAKVSVSNLKPQVANPIADPPAVSYGQPVNFQFAANTFIDPDGDSLSYSATGMPPGVVFAAGSRAFSGIPTQAGVFKVTVSAKDSGLPSLTASNSFTLTVSPAVLEVAALPQTKSYGAGDPPLTYSVTGLQLSDTAAEVLSGALTRVAGESVGGGPYAIGPGTLAANGNYVMTFTANVLIVNPVPLIVAADNQSKLYGAADPGFTTTFTGFVNGETQAVLGGSLVLARAPGQTVGDYAINPSGLTSSNYLITFNPGTLRIIPARLSVTADPKTKTYGSPDPGFTASYSGFVNGDNSSSLAGILAFARTPGENVGSYSITPGGLTSSNYDVTFITGTLTITPASLSVMSDLKTKVYGAADPLFTVSYSGFVNGDTPKVLSGSLTFSRTDGENVGAYSITPAGLVSSNYSLTFGTGTLTITKATLTVAAEAKTKVYGSGDPVLTFAVTGFQFADTAASALSGNLSRYAGETVAGSPYTITQGTLTPNGNYAINYISNTLSIDPAPLFLTPDDKSKVYGSADPALTAAYSGFVNGETSAVLGGTLVLSRASGENAGNYPISASGVTDANYTINFNTGTFRITPAPLAVTADPKQKTFGQPDPPFTVSYTGLVSGDLPANLSGTLVISRVTGEGIGSYLITPGGLTSSNYSVTFNSAVLTIVPPAPVIQTMSPVNPTTVSLSWTSVSNAVYRVQYRSALETTNWTDIAGDVQATGSISFKTDTIAGITRFYRVRVVP